MNYVLKSFTKCSNRKISSFHIAVMQRYTMSPKLFSLCSQPFCTTFKNVIFSSAYFTRCELNQEKVILNGKSLNTKTLAPKIWDCDSRSSKFPNRCLFSSFSLPIFSIIRSISTNERDGKIHSKNCVSSLDQSNNNCNFEKDSNLSNNVIVKSRKLSSKNYQRSSRFPLVFAFTFAGLAYFSFFYLKEDFKITDILKCCLAKFELFNIKLIDYVNDWVYKYFPDSTDPLLPDFAELKYPEFLPTLVIDMDKTILSLEHERRTGWRVVKRPGADRFFKELLNYYEIVVWSDDNYPVAQDVMMKWGVPIIGCIHRDQCRKRQGHYIKDLSRLGRRLDRVVIIDHDPMAFKLHPENGILIKEYDGDTDDRELDSLIDLLKTIATSPDDVRKQIKQYGGGDVYIGKRFLALKSEQEKKAESRRYFGKAFGVNQNQISPTTNLKFKMM